jgi:hypothetical protein
MRRSLVLFALLAASTAAVAAPAGPTETYRLSVVCDQVIVAEQHLAVPAQGTANFSNTREVPYQAASTTVPTPVVLTAGDQQVSITRSSADTTAYATEGLTAHVSRLASLGADEMVRLDLEYAQIESIQRTQTPEAGPVDIVNRHVERLLQTVRLQPGQSLSFSGFQAANPADERAGHTTVVTLTREPAMNPVAAL